MKWPSSRYRLTALWTCIILSLLWGTVVTIKYHSFQYTGWDLALSAQIMWSLCQGTLSTSLIGGNFLMDHANYIAFLLVPLYYLFPSALTLLLLKTFTFFAGAYVLYLFSAIKLGGLWGLLIMIGYIFYPANMAMFFFEFNFENLAPPLILLALYLLEKKKFIPFLLSCLLLALVKENMPLVVMMLGLYAFITAWKKNKSLLRLAPFLLILGAGLFLLQLFIIQPRIMAGLPIDASQYWVFYQKLGDSPWKIISNLFLLPQNTWNLLFTERNTAFLAELFGPLALPSAFSPHVLLLGLPLVLQNLLSSSPGQQNIHFYYASSIAVFIFIASIESLARLQRKHLTYFLIPVIMATFVFNLTYFKYWPPNIPKQEKTIQGLRAHNILAMIPEDAVVMTTFKYLPWLSKREELYLLGGTNSPFTRDRKGIPDSAQFVLTDLKDRRRSKKSIKEILTSKDWDLVTRSGDIVLLERNPDKKESLIKFFSNHPSLEKEESPLALSLYMQLNTISIPESILRENFRLPVTYYWNILNTPSRHPQVNVSLSRAGQVLWEENHLAAYALPLKKGDKIKEDTTYTIPPLAPGKYSLQISITQNTLPTAPPSIQQNNFFHREIEIN